VSEYIAFVDESMRDSLAGGLYLLAAAVVARDDQAAVEHCLRRALGGKRRRVHWYHESERDRAKMLDTLASQPLRGVCAAVQPLRRRRQERARELALWTLVAHLELLSVTEIVFEARQDRFNARDRRTMGAVQRAGLASRVRYRFAAPDRGTPILWAADALAGALGRQISDGDDCYTKRLPDEALVVYDVPG